MRPPLPVITLILFFILLFAYTKLAGPIPFQVSSITTQKTDTFMVTGEGTATVPPDIANIRAGITANASTVKEAQEQINTTISKVSSAVKELGVEDKDIQTSGYNINPSYDFQSGRQRITGYSARTSLNIKVRKIDNINAVIDAATANGANEIDNISFDVDDKTKAQNEARKKAVEEAKRKAQQAASIAGFSLGKIINYNESFDGFIPPIPLGMGVRSLAEDKTVAETQIEPGSNEIKVTVTLNYEIR